MSGYKLLALVALAGFFLMVIAYSAQADDASLGAVGYGVVPLDSNQVTMTAEQVEAEIRDDQAWVTCVFTFTNAGPPIEVLMGFPQARSIREGEAPELMEFRAFVDDEEVPVTFLPNAQPQGEWDYEGWHTFKVPFAASQTRTMRNTYHGRLTWYSNGDRAFEYILRTGSTWQGPIGQADIVVRWERDRYVVPETLSARPSGYLQGQRELRWHFTNLEPTLEDDIRISFRPVYGPHNLGSASASSGHVNPAQTGYGLPAALFSDGDQATAWQSNGETAGAWIAWSYTGYPHYATPTLGLGILPGATDAEFRAHGRPKEILVRLARLKEGAELLPVFIPIEESFLNPVRQLEITEHHLTLEDAARWQFLQLEKPATILAFQVVVESVYPGERYNDVAIAEVLFPLLEEDLVSPPVLSPNAREEGPVGPMKESLPLVLRSVLLPTGMIVAILAGVGLFWLRRRGAGKRTW
ncbi:MAG: hypothetical protein H5T64_09685 [Chloroflexi bacterium]|nr:hypothetical protein [Chloroflexota bacterium]